MLKWMKIACLVTAASAIFGLVASLAVLGFTLTSLFAGFVVVCAVMGGIGLLLYLFFVHVVKSVIFTWRMCRLLGWTGWRRMAARLWYAFYDSPPMLQRIDDGSKIYWPGMRQKIEEREAGKWAAYDADMKEVSDHE
jgi:hypothetical protein